MPANGTAARVVVLETRVPAPRPFPAAEKKRRRARKKQQKTVQPVQEAL
jgi:hypothetical protein